MNAYLFAAGLGVCVLLLAVIVGIARDDHRQDRERARRAPRLAAQATYQLRPSDRADAPPAALRPPTHTEPRAVRLRRSEAGSIRFSHSIGGGTILTLIAVVAFAAIWITDRLPDIVPDVPFVGSSDDGGNAGRQHHPAGRHHKAADHGGHHGNRGGVTAATLRHDLAAVEVVGHLPDADDLPEPYDRDAQFGDWAAADGCDTRNTILVRDLAADTFYGDTGCLSGGILDDPYTGKRIRFDRSADPYAVQIDHVFPPGLAWYAGAADWTQDRRVTFYNDPHNLLAVDGPTNTAKSDDSPADWLPSNDAYVCAYLHRFLTVADTYDLAITSADEQTVRRTECR